MTNDLDTKLAAEEHQQGRPYLAEPEHCETCAAVDRAWMQATCEHEPFMVELSSLCGPIQTTSHCTKCGMSYELEDV